MRFHEKLDFLMSITGTSNALISRKANLDPSYISRLRRGDRNPIQDRTILLTMANHFVKYTVQDYQIDFLSDVIYPGYRDMDDLARTDLIADWLWDKGIYISIDEPDPISKITSLSTKDKENSSNEDTDSNIIYYGPEGRKQATLRFLAKIMKSNNKYPILLYNDSDSDWFIEDDKFKIKIVKGLKAATDKGHNIIVIHNTNRPLNDMIKSIEMWVPIHFSGAVKAYYYPKIRDNLFRRTIFVVPDTVALVSNAVEKETLNTASFLVEDLSAIKSFEDEYSSLLNSCVPLFNLYKNKDRRKFFDIMVEYDQLLGNTIYNFGELSLMTMPEDLLENVLKRTGNLSKKFVDTCYKRKKIFIERLKSENYYEIILKKEPVDIKGKKVSISHSSLSHGFPIYYHEEEYIGHLENFIKMAEEHENFHFILDDNGRCDIPMLVKENQGLVLLDSQNASIILETKEKGLTAAFYDYIRFNSDFGGYCETDKTEQISKLKEYIRNIQSFKL